MPDALLDAGGLDASSLHRFAGTILDRHAAAAPGDGAAFLRHLESLATTPALQAELRRQRPALARRAATRVRQFDPAPADILFGLAADLATLVADGRDAEANMLANRYLDLRPQGAAGWAALPLFVALQLSTRGEAARADDALRPADPRLVVIGGLSGTGKSTLSRLLGVRIGRSPGARVLRSDVFRKRLAGVAPETRLPPAHYTRQSDEETYEALFESADDHLACGSSVILDAVFMRRSERDVAEAIALRRRLPFTGIWLEAPERDRVARAAARTNDASDADADVVRAQSHRPVGTLGGWHRMRVNRPIDLIVPAARAILERKPA